MEQNTPYTLRDLRRINLDAYRGQAARHPKNHVVQCREWFVRVSNRGAVLVSPLEIKTESGWESVEYTTAI